MERKQRLDGAAVLILLGCCVLWGLNQVAAKAALAAGGAARRRHGWPF